MTIRARSGNFIQYLHGIQKYRGRLWKKIKPLSAVLVHQDSGFLVHAGNFY